VTRRTAYTGPLCPTDTSHGPLLSWAGTSGFWCGHSGHSIPPAERKGGLAETVRWFSIEEVEAAQARQVAS
jgi:hypothetical protein